MAYSITQGISDGFTHTYSDLGWTLKDAKAGSAKRKDSLVSIPGMNGVHDFSGALGAYYYDTREVQFEFTREFDDLDVMIAETEALERFIWGIVGYLHDDTIADGYYWQKAACTACEHAYNTLGLTATVSATYRVHPFKTDGTNERL